MVTYLVVVEKGDNNYSAYIPDLPGCVTTGDTVEDTLKNMHEAVALHIEGLVRDGDPIPRAHTVSSQFVEFDV